MNTAHLNPARSNANYISATKTEARDTLLRVENLRVSFKISKHDTVTAINGISFSIPRNAMVALVGESGSGKSVSSLAIMGLLSADTAHITPASRIIFEGKSLLDMPAAERRKLCGKDISMIFQEPMTSLNPVFTIGFQIAEVLRIHMGMNAKQARARVLALLDEVGIPAPETRINFYPNQLSGGQQQRVMIAIAIACEPKLLIADEPTTALDVTIQKQIIDLITALRHKHQMSVLFITHDLALVGEIADHVIVMRHGEIRETGTVTQIFDAPNDPYTCALLHCRPSLSARPWRLPVIDDYISHNQIQVQAQAQAQRQRGLLGDEEIILDVKNLGKSFFSRAGLFGRNEFKAVQDVSFKLAKGKTLGIVGESGSGKTTVGLSLLRLHQATTGQAIFDGKDILSMSVREFMPYKRRIQLIFQNPYASLNPRFTVEQILTEPMIIHRTGGTQAGRRAAAAQLLDKVGLPVNAMQRYPHEFSGGQRQRIAIARCLTMKPDILVCDESVSALDVSVQAQVLNLLQDLQEEFSLSYLFISHDLAVVNYIADQVMVMKQGHVVELANSDDLYLNPKEEYTRALLKAIPRSKSEQLPGGS